MPLNELEQLFPDIAAGPIIRNSPFTNERLIEESCDPEERADIELFGRISGYTTIYASQQAVESQSGTLAVTFNIELFGDTEGAAGNLPDVLADLQEALGIPCPVINSDEILTTQEIEEFTLAAPVGDVAHGVIVRVISNLQGPTNWTGVGFHRDFVGAAVQILHFDDGDHSSEAEELARRLDERIQAVLHSEQPIPE